MAAIRTDFKQTEVGLIPNDWEVKRLGDLVTFQRGYDLPLSTFENGEYPVIKSNGLAGFHSEFRAKGPGVLVGRSGKLGEPMFVNEDYWPHNTTLFSKQFHNSDPKFMYYFLKRLNLASYNAGSAVPTLNRNHIHPILVGVPPLKEQQSIALILTNLDSKIELTELMNKTLEAIEKAIFNHWFIDFEFPNQEGKPYRSSGGRMIDSELGKIPTEWKVGSISEIAENPRRGILPRSIVPGTAYLGLEHMPRRSIALSEWGDASDVVSNKFQFLQGEILFGKLRPYFHKVGVAAVNGVCSTDILVITPKSPEGYGLVLGHVSSDDFVKYTDASSTGTKMPRTNWDDMARYRIVIPTKSVALAFDEKIVPLIRKIISNILQTRTLAEIRESLLPKLMSGQIRVPVKVG